MACSWLAEALQTDAPTLPPALAGAVEAREWRNCCRVRLDARAALLTTSIGRLFDAVGALCGAAPRANYEGQAAVELEAMADPAERGAYELPIDSASGEAGPRIVLDPRATVRELVRDLETGLAPGLVSARFHNALAAATADACAEAADGAGLAAVVLSGGVFQNRLLLERCAELLHRRGLRVLVPRRLPPNDGGISYGQLAVAAARELQPSRAGG
jgi:hydrogenase maturation protein HypF